MKKQPTSGALRYIGDGSALDNVPARDLEQADINTLADRWKQDPGVTRAALIASGLYEISNDPPQPAAEGEV